MDWIAETLRAARRSAGALAGGAVDHRARHELRPGPRSAARVLDKQERGAISVYAQNRDYHDVIKGKLKEHRRQDRRAKPAAT